RHVEPTVPDTELVEQPQRRSGEVAELRVMPFPLQLADDHDRHDDLVLLEALERVRIGEEDTGVEDVRANTPGGLTRVRSLSRARPSSRSGSFSGVAVPATS